MKISEKSWKNYIERLRKIDNKAADKVVQYMNSHDYGTPEGMKALIDYSAEQRAENAVLYNKRIEGYM